MAVRRRTDACPQFDADGLLFPCYRHDTPKSTIIPNPPLPAHTRTINPETLRELLPQLEPQCHAVAMGQVVFADYKPFFTAFFVSPTIAVTARSNIYFGRSDKIIEFLIYTKAENPPQDPGMIAELLYCTEKKVGKEPIKGTEIESQDFVFLQLVQPEFTIPIPPWDSYLVPSTVMPEKGDIFFTVQFHWGVPQGFLTHECSAIEQLKPYSEQQINELLHARNRSVSVGLVRDRNAQFVSYSGSTGACSRGAPGFVVHGSSLSTQFCSIHHGSLFVEREGKQVFDPSTPSMGVLVSDPVFVEAYCKYVVPALSKLGPLRDDVRAFVKFSESVKSSKV